MKNLSRIGVLLSLLWCPLARSYVDEIGEDSGTLKSYRPIYALLGRPDTKVQLSFKVRVIRALPLHFAYTQLMFWELFTEPSSPFTDINYNPEFFYRLDFSAPTVERWLDLGAFEHESNGKTGSDSRAWDRVYVRYSTTLPFNTDSRRKFHISFKLGIPFSERSGGDFFDYRGYYELYFTLADVMGPGIESDDITLRFYPGGWNPFKGGQELTLRARPTVKALPYVVFQIFHGVAENMLNFRDERLGLRLGLGF